MSEDREAARTTGAPTDWEAFTAARARFLARVRTGGGTPYGSGNASQRGRVMAPSEAEDTSVAYLASTPVR
jgi:hypothetical protein